MTDSSSFLLGARIRPARFKQIGATITGHVFHPPELVRQTDYKTRTPLTWADGRPRMQLRVIVQIVERECIGQEVQDSDEDDLMRVLYVRGEMQRAVGQAMRQAGAVDLEVGGKLRVTFTAEAEQRPGESPKKLYAAQYRRPEQAQAQDTTAPPPASQPPNPLGTYGPDGGPDPTRPPAMTPIPF